MQVRAGLIDELAAELAELVPAASAAARRDAVALWVNALAGEFRTEQGLREVVLSRASMVLRREISEEVDEEQPWGGPYRRAGESGSPP